MTPELTFDQLHRFLNATPAPTLAPASAQRLNELEQVLAADDEWLRQLVESYIAACTAADNGDDVDEVVASLWIIGCKHMTEYQTLVDEASETGGGRFRCRFVTAIRKRMDRLSDLIRTIMVVWPELELETPSDIIEAVWTITITPRAYIRAMWNLFWSSIRHPLSETVIELKTGRVMRHL